jgi:S-DNA-T family DNA segregation ATPase FtsK/SpoIIIE
MHVSAGFLAVGLGLLGVVVWVLHKIGRALAAVLEALAALAVVFVALWWLAKSVAWALGQVAARWRTSLAVVGLVVWCEVWGWVSLAVAVSAVVSALSAWRLQSRVSFDHWCGRFLRSWWQRWAVYGRKLPKWLHACGLSVADGALPVAVTVNLLGRRSVARSASGSTSGIEVPKLLGVRSGQSWDEVRVQLVAGQKPEDFDEAARALAVARKVARCQIRELEPNVVSIDFQRRNLLASVVSCMPVPDIAPVDGTSVDLRTVWAGRTEYGQDWRLPLLGSGAHTLIAGASGAGKNSVLWCPLVYAAPAIRAGVIRISGIDPKGMELAYGRRIFARYGVTGKEALDVLDGLVAEMESRKTAFAGRVRMLPVSTEFPLELVEFDEIGALTRYTDRKTRDAIVERGTGSAISIRTAKSAPSPSPTSRRGGRRTSSSVWSPTSARTSTSIHKPPGRPFGNRRRTGSRRSHPTRPRERFCVVASKARYTRTSAN